MAIRITTVEEAIELTGIKILVHGLAGSGKTVLCATANETTMIINVEAGLLSLKKFLRENPKYQKKIKVATIESITDLEELRDHFQQSPEPLCSWICIDSASEIAEQIIGDEKKMNADKRAAYGNLTDRMLECFRDFRNLPGYNVCFTCKQAVEMIDDKPRYVPSFPGRQIGPAVPYLFDEVFALRVEDEEPDADGKINQYRVLQTSRDVRYEAKDRSGELDQFEIPNLEHIKNKIERGVNQNQKQQNKDALQDVEDFQIENFEEDCYYYHPESDSVLEFKQGEKIPSDDPDFNLCKQISKEEYEQILEKQKTEAQQEPEPEKTGPSIIE